MKKLIAFCAIAALFTLPLSLFAQKKIGEATMENGKVVALFDDGTWMYTASGKGEAEKKPTKVHKPTNTPQSFKSSSTSSYSSMCGARTKSGGACRRIVKGSGRCYQH